MRIFILILVTAALSLAACRKNTTAERREPPKPDTSNFSLSGGWRQNVAPGNWADRLIFAIGVNDSNYRHITRSVPTMAALMEEGPFHAKTIGKDSMEVQLKDQVIIIEKVSYYKVNITRADSTREFLRMINPG